MVTFCSMGAARLLGAASSSGLLGLFAMVVLVGAARLVKGSFRPVIMRMGAVIVCDSGAAGAVGGGCGAPTSFPGRTDPQISVEGLASAIEII
ncbi:hypothetical protein DPMN_094598 [Dreissena polymorpha]|uniref:Uncharacterized protein n=1 Tax=Dreissena polymorpha TaxID=45954 RepID=A0A9D4L7Y1_DREPO|nr:hypothetical protein DPMN_094598 [Dreissena polymorpha]